MSQNFAAVAQEMWDPIFETQLENTEVLAGAYRIYASVLGDTYNRRLGSFGELAPIGFNAADIPVSSITYSETPIALFPYAYKTVVSEREMVIVGSQSPSSQVLQEEARTHAFALGRYKDYLVLNSIFSNLSPYTATTVAKTIGATTGMNSAKIIQARSLLQNNGVLDPELYGVMSALLQPALAADEKYSSWFYNQNRPLTAPSGIPEASFNYFAVMMRIMGGVGINSLPFTTSGENKTFNCPVWQKDVITLAMSALMPKTTIWYNPGQLRYEITSQLVMGAAVTQTDGVAIIQCDTANTANA